MGYVVAKAIPYPRREAPMLHSRALGERREDRSAAILPDLLQSQHIGFELRDFRSCLANRLVVHGVVAQYGTAPGLVGPPALDVEAHKAHGDHSAGSKDRLTEFMQ